MIIFYFLRPECSNWLWHIAIIYGTISMTVVFRNLWKFGETRKTQITRNETVKGIAEIFCLTKKEWRIVMKIQLRKQLREEFIELEVKKGTTLEEIYKSMADELPYTVLAAKVNNKLVTLAYKVHMDSKIEFLDMRTQVANLIYQNSMILIYLKAVYDVLGDYIVDVQNAIDKGLYTEIKSDKPVTAAQVKAIENRMRELVDADLPLERIKLTRDEAAEFFIKSGREGKIALLEENPSMKRIPFYNLDGYMDFFYALMCPSTSYVKYFELRKYHHGVLIRFPHPSNPNEIPPYDDERALYKTFAEEKRWGKLMEISYVSDLNERIDEGKLKELIQISEALHESKIVEITNDIIKQNKRIILIAGPSSSGKTTFAQRLCIQLRVHGKKPLYLGTDDYFVEREDTPLDEYGEMDFENLGAVDIDLFNDNMNDLLAGKEVDLPVFDFITGHKKFGTRKTRINQNQPIVIEGIHALNEALTPKIPHDEKYKIYISPLIQLNIDNHNRISTTDHRMLRRMVRDYKYRGHSARDTINSWPKVRKGEDKNIFPFSNQADVVFNSVHLYEISVLKKYARPLLDEITRDEPEYADAHRLLNFLRFFKTAGDEDAAIANNSILREFIGGSIFVD